MGAARDRLFKTLTKFRASESSRSRPKGPSLRRCRAVAVGASRGSARPSPAPPIDGLGDSDSPLPQEPVDDVAGVTQAVEPSTSSSPTPQPPLAEVPAYHGASIGDQDSHPFGGQSAGREHEAPFANAPHSTSPIDSTSSEDGDVASLTGVANAGHQPCQQSQQSQREDEDPLINVHPPSRSTTWALETMQANVSGRLQRTGLVGLLQPPSPKSSGTRPSSNPRERDPPPNIDEPELNAPIFPKKITVTVYFTFTEERILMEDNKLESFDWTVPENYEALIPKKILEKVQKTYGLESEQMYPRHGSCRVSGPPGLHLDEHYAILDDLEVLSQKAIVQICGFISKYPCHPLSLEVYLDYGFVKLQNFGDYSYAEMIKREMKRKVKLNFLGFHYIPRCDLDFVLSLGIVDRIIKEDVKLQLDGAARKDFIAKVVDKGRKLFAICVFQGINMEFLRHLLDVHGCSDDPSNRPRHNTSGACDQDDCGYHMKDIIACLPQFFVQDIARNYQHRDLDENDVLPLFHTGEKNQAGRPTSFRLGENEGAVGKVYKVTLDPSHHYVSGDPYCEFAVKEFSQFEAFERERVMLEAFANFPEAHIAEHIMTWTQRGAYYILYDKAKSSLRKYINNTKHPELSNSVVIWFLKQLEGLAKAIKHVHHFKKPTRTNPVPEQDDKWGRHNDIKPENILVFQKDERQHPVFKITDFGQGVLKDARGKEASERDPRALGTRAYWSPETGKKRAGVSRPIDMWALGCVFLELLLWLFGFYQDHNASGFSTAREAFPGYDVDNLDDMFWYKEVGRRRGRPSKLKPAVEKVLRELTDEHCKEMRAFQRVIEAIQQLLEIDPDKRMTSEKLMEWISQVVRQTEGDLRDIDTLDFYQRQYRYNRGGSEVGEQLLSERLNPEGSPSVSRAPSSSSSLRNSPLPDHPSLLHTESAPPVLLHAGFAALATDQRHTNARGSFAPDGQSGDEDDQALQREMEDLGPAAGPSNH